MCLIHTSVVWAVKLLRLNESLQIPRMSIFFLPVLLAIFLDMTVCIETALCHCRKQGGNGEKRRQSPRIKSKKSD